jgi:pimeloyl-ACP methyl ester carboxylesterase
VHEAKLASGVSIASETFGEPGDAPVLLVMGFGAQMIAWHEDFCSMLAGRGRYVIRYDNRDCGLSSRLDDQPVDMGQFIAAVSSGDIPAAQAMIPYSLQDMADDGMGLLAALGIEKAHIVGSSMGGMIAQAMAITHPARVLTLTSMMSSTGEPGYGQATPAAQQALLASRPSDRDGYIAASEREMAWSSRRYANADAIRELAARSYDRAYYPAGTSRQLGAMILAGSRADELKALDVPTLVIHGLDDTLINPSGGKRTSELIPGSLKRGDSPLPRPAPHACRLPSRPSNQLTAPVGEAIHDAKVKLLLRRTAGIVTEVR